MRYLKYVKIGEKYYEQPDKKKNHSHFGVSFIPEGWKEGSDGHWTYYMNTDVVLPSQGWKIHISSIVEEGQLTLDIVSKHLFNRGVSFKAVSDRLELSQKNSKYGDRGSSGKFMTIYPRTEKQFLSLLGELHELLRDMAKGPYILSDKRWWDGNVYFRYGAFEEMYLSEGAAQIPAIRTPSGKYIPDSRGVQYVLPSFVEEPKEIQEMTRMIEMEQGESSRLENYIIESALHFSNGGGVYLAKDKKSREKYVLKEGRPGAGLDGKGRDAVRRLKHEASILRRLSGVKGVVQYKDIFQEWEHTFLVEEHIPGIPLNTWLALNYPFSPSSDSDFYVNVAVSIIKNLKEAVEQIHKFGIGMGDLQPTNVMITPSNEVKLIDFESASETVDKEHSGLMTPGFIGAPNLSREQADWFALSRIARYTFIPIGPVQDMAERILVKHDQWIIRKFGHEAFNVIKEIENECYKRNAKPVESIVSAPSVYFQRDDIPEIIKRVRKGIVEDLRDEERLLPGDIRQFESPNGLINVLTGGFGIVMALFRTGELPHKAKKWAEKFSRTDILKKLDNGLFTGRAGIAGILYEIGMIEEAREVYDSISIEDDIEDISLMSGLSGTGLALLSAATLDEFEYLFDKVLAIAGRLEFLVQKDISVTPKDIDSIPIGLLDGWSGVSLFLSALYQFTSEKKWLDLSIHAIEKDISRCIFDDTGSYQVDDVENSRLMPYLSGGSAGVGLAMMVLQRLLNERRWDKELLAIGVAAKSKCFYGVGLFRGLSGLIVYSSAIDMEFGIEKDNHVDVTLEALNLYLLDKNGVFYTPGDYCYKMSGDLFSGSAGLLLALKGVDSSWFFPWMPIPEYENLFPGSCVQSEVKYSVEM